MKNNVLLINQITPSDADLFGTLKMLPKRHEIDYGTYTCTLDVVGHRYGHDYGEKDHTNAKMPGMLAHLLPLWPEAGNDIALSQIMGEPCVGTIAAMSRTNREWHSIGLAVEKAPKKNCCWINWRLRRCNFPGYGRISLRQ